MIVPKEIATNATMQLTKPISGSSPPNLGQTTIKTPIKPKKIPIHLSTLISSLMMKVAKIQVNTGCKETIREEMPAAVPLVIEKNTPPK